jgi:hypothetical protein
MPKKKVGPTSDEVIDARPDPKPRKYPQLWQSYLLWDELMKMRQRHNLRISSAERGKSQMDVVLEQNFIEHLGLDENLELARKTMINYGKATGEIWKWTTSIKGLGAGGEAAKLIAQVDDIARFDTIAKLWRFAGYGVIDGKAEKNQMGEKSHFNRNLKSICFCIADQFIRQQTPGYSDIYYAEKARLRIQHPEPVKEDNKNLYTDGHIHNRAWRKMIKQFLADFWLQWRVMEGLPVSRPYVITLV